MCVCALSALDFLVIENREYMVPFRVTKIDLSPNAKSQKSQKAKKPCNDLSRLQEFLRAVPNYSQGRSAVFLID
jgi:hypothetical protein